jgi:hypothetical protein
VVQATTDPGAASAAVFDGAEAHFQSNEAFKPTEFFELREIVAIDVVAFPEAALVKFGINVTSDEFRAAFPQGVPTLRITVRGIDVEYAWDPDRVKRIEIPMYNYDGKNFGKPKGENSQLELVLLAFQRVFGVKPLGAENRAKLIGKKARWGQHIGKGDVTVRTGGVEAKTWRWDVPREALPDNYAYSGPVKILGAGSGDAGSAAPVATNELDVDSAVEAILTTIAGHPVTNAQALMEATLSIKGLPQRYVEMAINKTLLQELANAGLIDQQDGKIVRK